MAVRNKGSISEQFEMPGGGPQGTNLGILAYLVNINSCGVSLESLSTFLQETLADTEICHPILPLHSVFFIRTLKKWSSLKVLNF